MCYPNSDHLHCVDEHARLQCTRGSTSHGTVLLFVLLTFGWYATKLSGGALRNAREESVLCKRMPGMLVVCAQGERFERGVGELRQWLQTSRRLTSCRQPCNSRGQMPDPPYLRMPACAVCVINAAAASGNISSIYIWLPSPFRILQRQVPVVPGSLRGVSDFCFCFFITGIYERGGCRTMEQPLSFYLPEFASSTISWVYFPAIETNQCTSCWRH